MPKHQKKQLILLFKKRGWYDTAMINAQTLKGFRDFLPKEARKRQYVINTLKEVFELYGFDPLETPALEYEEILLGKYGEEGDKLMYRFEDNGKRRVALRYDQTVPLARVVAQYQNDLPTPFKRYQIQNVYRAENTQKGRFREFLQCDIDTVGSSSPLSDAEVIAVAAKSLEKLGFKKYKILINDRAVFSSLSNVEPLTEKELITFTRAIDKIKKIGRENVVKELENQDFSTERATFFLQKIETQTPTEKIKSIFSNLEGLGINPSNFEFMPMLARGLDYYTGLIFEIEIDGYSAGSVCGGGRYDNLIGMFGNRQVPAVGFAFGFDRTVEAMEELSLFPKELNGTKVLVTIFPALSGVEGSMELGNASVKAAQALRDNNINTELWLDAETKLEKQLKYADQKQIPYIVVIGPEEVEKNVVQLKNMKTREQKQIPLDVLQKELS